MNEQGRLPIKLYLQNKVVNSGSLSTPIQKYRSSVMAFMYIPLM